MNRVLAVCAALALVAVLAPAAAADHNDDLHSDNMELVGNFDEDGEYRAGSDLAFWGDTAVVGQFDSPGGFRLMDISDPEDPQQTTHFECPGPQNDVSIWEDLVFLSVDNARGEDEDHAAEECGAADATDDQILAGEDWSGIRIVDISDPTDPEKIVSVRTDCGSHTHTLVPDEDEGRILVYVQSYPLRDQGPNCGADGHGKISVVEVPLDDPAAAEVVSEPDVSPPGGPIGCHDVTVFLEHDLAAAACISESQMWDISDPVNPEIVSRIHNPAINIHHSSFFSWDAEVLVLGDEMGGAAAAAGCLGLDDGEVPTGALWFYDVSDPESPELQSFYKIPEQDESIFCTAHQFNAVPLESDRNILVAGWYTGGVHVLDFTDPENVERIGHYIAKDEPGEAAAWAGYWYNGHIYASNFDESFTPRSENSRGFDVFTIDHPDVADHITLDRLNPYTMEPLPEPDEPVDPEPEDEVDAAPAPDEPPTPVTGGSSGLALAGLLALAAAILARRFALG